MLKIGIIGCGTIGSKLARAIVENFPWDSRLIGVHDIDRNKSQALSQSINPHPSILSQEELIDSADLIIESASKEACAKIARAAISKGKDIMVMSVGGLIDSIELFEEAKTKSCRIYIPSGAICGLDGIKGAIIGGIKRVVLTTRKPPLSLDGAPYIVKNRIDLNSIKCETLLFEGSAREAIDGFPQNINVSVALSLAGLGVDKTRVRIITSPDYKFNTHEIEAEGEFGKLTTKTENIPSPDNPKTSYLAILSAIAMLRGILSPVKIGT